MDDRISISKPAKLCLACALFCFALLPVVARGQTSTVNAQLGAASSDSILWLLVGEWDSKEKSYLDWFAYMDKSSGQIHPANAIRPQKGKAIRWAVVDKNLHVFYENGTHYRYTTGGERREVRLASVAGKQPDVPEAIAGESGGGVPVLWAVVNKRTAKEVSTEWAHTLQFEATQPAEDFSAPASQPASMPAASSRPATEYALVQYNGAAWQAGFAVPEQANAAKRLWLCVSNGRFHLFWHEGEQDPKIHYAWCEHQEWTLSPTITLSQAPHDAVAAVANNQLVFAALVRAPDRSEASRLRCETWSRTARGDEAVPPYWTQGGALKTADGKMLYSSPGTTMTPFGDDLVILQMGAKQAEVGYWSLHRGGPPGRDFKAVPLQRNGGETGTPRSLQQVATTLIVALILMLVFWRRQSSLAMPAALPPGLIVARMGKRAMAAMLDMLPAMAVVSWWWYQPMMEFWSQAHAAAANPDAYPMLLPDELLWAGICFRVLYTAYCLSFELGMAQTPGKWMLGCYVLSESLNRPTWVQVLIRNATRLIELEPLLSLWPFVLVMFFTRNRQRVGDLAAHTLIVERLHGGVELPDESQTP